MARTTCTKHIDPERRENSFADEAPLLDPQDLYKGGAFFNPNKPSCRCILGHARALCNVPFAYHDKYLNPKSGALLRICNAISKEMRERLGLKEKAVVYIDHENDNTFTRAELSDIWNTVITHDLKYTE